MKRIVLCALASLALGAVVGCSSDKSDKPMALVKIKNGIDVRRVWSIKLGGEAPKLQLSLDVAVSGNRVYAANYKGQVDAFDLSTGKRLWQRALKKPFDAGPAAGFGMVVVGSAKGDVIALSENDGTELWRIRINSEILSAAAIGADIVVVRAVDGKMHGLSAKDGSEQWVADQQVPRLTLRGTSRPILVGDLAICGFDNGHVMAVAVNSGNTAWEAAVGQARGNTELARLTDEDAQVIADGDDLFAVAYQGRVVRMSRETGQISWAHDLSSYRGLTVDADGVYVSTADGDVVRLDRNNGTEKWRQKGLERRQISAPVLYGGRLVVGDIDGVVHWLDTSNGKFIAREADGKKRISSTPVVAGNLLLVFGDAGNLAAFRAPAATTVATATSALPGGG